MLGPEIRAGDEGNTVSPSCLAGSHFHIIGIGRLYEVCVRGIIQKMEQASASQ